MDEGFNHVHLRWPRNVVPNTKEVALDVGGTMAKVAWVARETQTSETSDVIIHLRTFLLDHFDDCLGFVKRHILPHSATSHIHARAIGVGCVKYYDHIAETLGVPIHTDDNEVLYSACGMGVLWRHLSQADVILRPYSDVTGLRFGVPFEQSGLTPCLLVSLGTAMTCTLIEADGRLGAMVGGSSLAGMSFLGLGSMLTSAKSFQDLLKLAERGDRRNVDLLVKDTAGSGYNNITPDSMVSSFGKPAKSALSGEDVTYKEEDIAHSLLFAITDNLAHQCFNIARCYQLSRICFCGSYLNFHTMAIIAATLKRASEFLQVPMHPVFLQNSGYLGAIGALFSDAPGKPNGTHAHDTHRHSVPTPDAVTSQSGDT